MGINKYEKEISSKEKTKTPVGGSTKAWQWANHG